MRAMSYILVIIGLWMLGDAVRQEYRGVTDNPVIVGGSSYTVVLSGEEIVKNRNPDAFRNAMTVHWFYAGSPVFLGVVLFLLVRKEDRIDPLSPDFDWKDEQGDV